MKIWKAVRIAAAVIGLGLCCYPAVSRAVNTVQMRGVISTYESIVAVSENAEVEQMMTDAKRYNEKLYEAESGLFSDDIEKEYSELLNASGTGMMGTLEIPKIDVHLPVFHGTGDDVLAAGVGHLQGSSLPVGGDGSHCILTGHRGLPSAKLFTRLDEMEPGDLFVLHTGNEAFAYRVADIQVVDPKAEIYSPQPGKDKVSLVTCTPYGINTERLIVTGERTEYSEEEIAAQESHAPSVAEVVILALPLLLAVVLIIFLIHERRVKKCAKNKEN